jgi:cardiolipin synthase
MPVTRLAKWKTAFQMLALSSLMLNNAAHIGYSLHVFGEGLLWLAAAMTLVTGYSYVRAGLKHF